MKHFGAVCRGGIHFGSCYLHCNWDANRKTNLDLLEAIGARIGTLKGPWIIGGDWQCPPDDLRETGWLKTVKGTIYAPAAPTCGDRALDYFVVSEGLAQAGAIVAACTVGDAGYNPHSPSRLIVKADARAVMVRQLKVPVGFGASLPYGPANRQSSPLALRDPTAEVDEGSCSDARTIDDLAADYDGLIGTIEKELCSVAGLDGLQAEGRSGRAGGAKFCWKPAMGDDTEGATKTTFASRAWRRTSKWLADVNHTKVAKNAEAARWRIRFYRHPKPDAAQATHEQLWSFKVFEDWRACIQGGQLHSKPWVEMLRHVATKQAEKEEAAAQLASIQSYKLWIDGGAAGGLEGSISSQGMPQGGRRQQRAKGIPTSWVSRTILTGFPRSRLKLSELKSATPHLRLMFKPKSTTRLHLGRRYGDASSRTRVLPSGLTISAKFP